MLTTCKYFTASAASSRMSKLKSVLGFRPTEEEESAISAAELATGKTRSDIMRACFRIALNSVVEAMLAEHAAHVSAFRDATKAVTAASRPTVEYPVNYRTKRPK